MRAPVSDAVVAGAIRHYLRLMLPYRSLAITFAASYMYSLMAGLYPLAGLALSALFTAMTGGLNTLNSWADVAGDRLSWPERPLPSGAVSQRAALGFFSVLLASSIGLLVSLILPEGRLALLLLFLVDVGVIVAYSLEPVRLKRYPIVPNLIVSAHVLVFPAIASWLLTAFAKPFPVFLIGFLFLEGVANAMIEDFTDLAADRATKDASIPLVLGITRARSAVAGVFLMAAGLAASGAVMMGRPWIWIVAMVMQIPLIISARELSDNEVRNRKVYSNSVTVSQAIGGLLLAGYFSSLI